jgi:hypothetical protein
MKTTTRLISLSACLALMAPIAAQAQNATGIDGRLPQASVPEEPPKPVAKKSGKKKRHAQSDDFRAKVPGEPKAKKKPQRTA